MRSSLAAALMVAILAGCAGAPSASSGPDRAIATDGTPAATTSGVAPRGAATSEPTLEPEASPVIGPAIPTTQPTGPSWTPRPIEALLLESMITVSVDRLNKRRLPSTGSKILGVVEKGDFLRVVDYGPFVNDGYRWYAAKFVAKAGEPPVRGVDHDEEPQDAFWVAVGKDATEYVKQLRPRCPETIELNSLSWMLGAELLACFGSNSIELAGTFGCGGCGGARVGTYEPSWLAFPLISKDNLSAYPIGNAGGSIFIRFPPGGSEEPPPGSVIRVRGHYDDPAAESCSMSVVDPMHPSGETLVPIPAAAAHLLCAQQFVVESFEVLGTDPGFIFG